MTPVIMTQDGSDLEDFYGGSGAAQHSSSNEETGFDGAASSASESEFDFDEIPIAKLSKPLITEEDLKNFKKEKDRTGIVYISRIPPAMTPSNVRQYLSPFGSLGRVYLAPDVRAEKALKKLSKRERKSKRPKSAFTEGWVEFLSKKKAKVAVKVLNGAPFGGSRSSRFREDLWCLRYLGGDFKWSNLTEQISYENAVREQKLREEFSQARRENKSFLRQVETARVQKKIAEKRQKSKQLQMERKPSEPQTQTTADSSKAFSIEDLKNRFRQRKPIQHQN